MKLNRQYNMDCRVGLKQMIKDNQKVDTVITSPPYYKVRDYEIPPSIFGGDPNCNHDFSIETINIKSTKNKDFNKRYGGSSGQRKQEKSQQLSIKRGFCSKCNAWLGTLGNEPSISLYISHLCNIFDLVKEVLNNYGSLWVNLGDTMSTQGGQNRTTDKDYSDYSSIKLTNRMIGVPLIKPKELPPKCECGIPSRFKIEMIDNHGWILRRTIIWEKPNCLSQMIKLYAKTQKGVTVQTLKDLVRLDPNTVQLWDGNQWNQVIKWVKNENPEGTLRILLRNGEIIKSTIEHIFIIKDKKTYAYDLKIGDILDSCQLPDEGKTYELIPDEIGWFIGIYLAEGSRSQGHHSIHNKCIQISSHKKEIHRFNKCKEIADKYDGYCYKYEELNSNKMSINLSSKVLNGILDIYIGGKTAKTKHLTSKVWQRNNHFLKYLLFGYLEGDGHFDEKNNRWRLGFTRNNELASDLRTICSRLGYKIKLQKIFSKIGNKKYKSYKGEIRVKKSNHFNIKSDYEIIDIKNNPQGFIYYDIILKNKPHLFSTASGVLIHNCMPSSVKDNFTPNYEYIFWFVKNSKKLYWTNKKTLQSVSKKPLGTKGIENIDWEWKICTKCEGKGFIENGEQCPSCKGLGKRKGTLWRSHDYYFEQQREALSNNPATQERYRYRVGDQSNRKDDGIKLVKPGKAFSKYFPKNLVHKTRGYKTKPNLESNPQHHGVDIKPILSGRNMRNIWHINVGKSSEPHFAQFPMELVERPIKSTTPKFICSKCGLPRVKTIKAKGGTIGTSWHDHKNDLSMGMSQKHSFNMENYSREFIGYTDCNCGKKFIPGVVLDPFGGIGTTSKVAYSLGRNYISFEISKEYCDIFDKWYKNQSIRLDKWIEVDS